MKALDALNNQMGLGRSSLLSYDDWLKANPNAGAGAQAPSVGGGGKSIRDYAHAGAEIGDVLGLDPFGSKKKKKKKQQQQAAANAAATDQAQRGAYDAYVTDFNNSRAEDPGTFGDLNRDFTLADFQKDPGYEFRLSEGEKGINRAAAARGGLVSGAALKDLDRYDQDYASGEFSNAYNRFNNDRASRFNRLSTMAGLGTSATTQLINNNQTTANNVGDLMTQVGNVNAARDISRGNANADAVTTLGNFYLQNRFRGGVAGGAYGTGRGSGGATSFQYNDTSPMGAYV
jgi:hypothetical protein